MDFPKLCIIFLTDAVTSVVFRGQNKLQQSSNKPLLAGGLEREPVVPLLVESFEKLLQFFLDCNYRNSCSTAFRCIFESEVSLTDIYSRKSRHVRIVLLISNFQSLFLQKFGTFQKPKQLYNHHQYVQFLHHDFLLFSFIDIAC